MTRIVITGAGGMTFPLTLTADLLALPALHGAALVLHDPDLARATRTAHAAQAVAEAHHLPLDLTVTDDRRAALHGATHVLLTFQVGGLAAYRTDLDIPRRYGVDCVAGDTLNPGGVMRFVRSTPAFEALAQDVLALCPDALILNYTNPMAMNCLYLHRLGLRVVGLCHSIPGTAQVISALLGLNGQDLTYRAAGINHQAWFLELSSGGIDLQERLRTTLRERFLPSWGGTTPWTEGAATYSGGQERVRAELMETFGYFTSESSHHASEYVPYFRASPASTQAQLPRRWDYLRTAQASAGQEEVQTRETVSRLRGKLEPSGEFGMPIIAAHTGGPPAEIYVNVQNDGWIDNLPPEACVEVPAHVDTGGVHPAKMGRLPGVCAGLNLTGIALQTAVVDAVLQRDVQALIGAFALDPLTARVLDLPRIRQMARELMHAQARWMPPWVRGLPA
ncbi:MAG: family 4 glycosyl hydrolase, alpha-galactosidase/6-phospho-beta-glucosidase [Deinococcus sp.]|nr:family 4 glycosyl hydrolase, alpha-galactosidase/6-phospho-beta-glucosidase [Deinococcus sp.]